MGWTRVFASVVLAIVLELVTSTTASALTVDLSTAGASRVGEPVTFRATVADASGTVEYRWDFGDGTRTEFVAGQQEVTHTFTAAGHYSVVLLARDASSFGSVAVVHVAHHPITSRQPTASTSIVYDAARERIYTVNPDNDTITAIDATHLRAISELEVYGRPEALAIAPDGRLWVVHRDDFAVAIVNLDRFEIEAGFRLPYASQPIGIAMSPVGATAFVTLMATGRMVAIDTQSLEVRGEASVGPWPRGVAVSNDGADVYVTRFLSSDAYGEVVRVDAETLTVRSRIPLALDATPDGTQAGRGLPNYLFSIALSPDGRYGWVPAKKDNIERGIARDGLPLQQENTVRAMVSVVDLARDEEMVELRRDLDDRNLPMHVTFSPLGDYAFVAAAGSSLIEVRDTYTGRFVTALKQAGVAPVASVLGPGDRLFVHAFLSRNVVVYDVGDILASVDTLTRQITAIPTVTDEKLAADVLLGKQIFYNSADERMSGEGYISCATCHFDGFEDGRVWDFTNLGEGFRNTVSLLGRRGMGHGPVHWSGNFDEIQDFEHPIRALFGGTGFLPEDAALGTPLGAPKAGLSEELDALAAYVTSLDTIHRSPHRNSDGTLTVEAERGKEHFLALGCDTCHTGPDYTDSARGVLHTVGTLKPTSGTRLGEALQGIDTPTLLGIWETAPYFHDGSAQTLHDVLTTTGPDDPHDVTARLDPGSIAELVAFLEQIDEEQPLRPLPFEGPAEPPGTDAGTIDGDAATSPPPEHAGIAPRDAGCGGCATTGGQPRAPWLGLLLLLFTVRPRPRRA